MLSDELDTIFKKLLPLVTGFGKIESSSIENVFTDNALLSFDELPNPDVLTDDASLDYNPILSGSLPFLYPWYFPDTLKFLYECTGNCLGFIAGGILIFLLESVL